MDLSDENIDYKEQYKRVVLENQRIKCEYNQKLSEKLEIIEQKNKEIKWLKKVISQMLNMKDLKNWSDF